MIIAEILFGTTPLLIKLISDSIPASLIVALRYMLACFVLLPIIVFNKAIFKSLKVIRISHILMMIFLGISAAGLGSFLYVLAISRIGAVLTAYISNLEIVIAIVLSMIIFGERLSLKYAKVALLVCFGFILLIYKNSLFLQTSWSYVLGILFCLLTALLWGGSTIIGKHLMNNHIKPSFVTFVRLFIGSIFNFFLTLFSFGTNTIGLILKISLFEWIILFLLGVIISGLGFILYYKALGHSYVKGSVLLFTLSPIVTLVIGTTLGKETMQIYQYIGAGFILIGTTLLVKHNI